MKDCIMRISHRAVLETFGNQACVLLDFSWMHKWPWLLEFKFAFALLFAFVVRLDMYLSVMGLV